MMVGWLVFMVAVCLEAFSSLSPQNDYLYSLVCVQGNCNSDRFWFKSRVVFAMYFFSCCSSSSPLVHQHDKMLPVYLTMTGKQWREETREPIPPIFSRSVDSSLTRHADNVFDEWINLSPLVSFPSLLGEPTSHHEKGGNSDEEPEVILKGKEKEGILLIYLFNGWSSSRNVISWIQFRQLRTTSWSSPQTTPSSQLWSHQGICQSLCICLFCTQPLQCNGIFHVCDVSSKPLHGRSRRNVTHDVNLSLHADSGWDARCCCNCSRARCSCRTPRTSSRSLPTLPSNLGFLCIE